MDGYYTYQRRQAIPLANPTVVISSNVSTNEVLASVKPKYSQQTLLLLIAIFVFVSLMVGTLLWILQYELHKRSTSFLYYSFQVPGYSPRYIWQSVG